MRHVARFAVVVLALAAVSACAARTPEVEAQPANAELERIRLAVQRALVAPPPAGYAAIPPGVRVLGVSRREDAVVIDLTRELLSQGTGRVMEDALHQILTAASSVPAPESAREARFRILIDGEALETYLAKGD